MTESPQLSPGETTPRTPRDMSDEKLTVSDMQQVVINDEDQYSLWPRDTQPPAGWRPEGFTGSRQECLDHIDVVWTDMRPRSVREHSVREHCVTEHSVTEHAVSQGTEGGA